ncbi:MAG: serine/threonine protein kinase [Bradymonadia bacterium]
MSHHDLRPDDDQPDPLIGQTIADRFTVIAPIGAGGMGTVYRAVQQPVERPVALKILAHELCANPQAVKRFLHEAKIISKLKQVNTVTLYDFGPTGDGRLYIAMELIEGLQLRELIELGPMAVERALDIVEQIARSLAEAHEMGVIHRDLKPENIMISRSPEGGDEVRVVDFGIAKLHTGHGTLTQPGTMVGTPAYMSPEHALSGQVDARADVYALGIILFEMLTGAPLFDAETPIALLYKQVHDAPRRPRALRARLPWALDDLVMRMLSKEADERPQHAGALLEALAALDLDAPEPAQPPETLNLEGPVPEPVVPARDDEGGDRRRPLLLGALLLVVVGVSAALSLWPSEKAPVMGPSGPDRTVAVGALSVDAATLPAAAVADATVTVSDAASDTAVSDATAPDAAIPDAAAPDADTPAVAAAPPRPSPKDQGRRDPGRRGQGSRGQGRRGQGRRAGRRTTVTIKDTHSEGRRVKISGPCGSELRDIVRASKGASLTPGGSLCRNIEALRRRKSAGECTFEQRQAQELEMMVGLCRKG